MNARMIRRLAASALVAWVLSGLTAGAAHAGTSLSNHNEMLER
jgi:hypothetical protein